MPANRTRHWMTIVYPESAPTNWKSILSEQCVPAIVSPLHDKDTNPDGTAKKPHWHVLLLFNGVKSLTQVSEICSKFGGIMPQAVSNAQSMARYFIHKDNPEKFQYNDSEIENFSGADWSDLVKTSKDRYDTLCDILSFIDKNNITYYSDIVSYSMKNNRQWFETCVDNTLSIRAHCLSKATKQKDLDVRQLHTLPDRPS